VRLALVVRTAVSCLLFVTAFSTQATARPQATPSLGAGPAAGLGAAQTPSNPLPGSPLDVSVFGAYPADDGADDQPAIQAAIDQLELNGGGTLLFPAGVFQIGSTLRVSKPIWIVGAGTGDDSSVPSAMASGLTVLRWDPQGPADPMLRVLSKTADNWLHGGGVRHVLLDGSHVASMGIHASSTSEWSFAGDVRAVTTAGILLDGANGVVSSFNRIESLKFTSGSRPATRDADGLVLDGATQSHVISVYGTCQDGDMIEFRAADNNIVEKLQGGPQAGGSGQSVRFSAGAAAVARNNLLWYVVGPVHAEAASFGNRIAHLVSEGSVVTIDDGAQMHYQIEDQTTSGLYQTAAYCLTDVREIGTHEFDRLAGAASPGIAARHWTAWELTTQGGDRIGANISPPGEYDNGKLTRLDIAFTTKAPNLAADWTARVLVLVRGSQTGASLATADVDMTVSLPAWDMPNTYNVGTLWMDVPYRRGDMIFLSIERLGGDSVQGAVQILGGQLHYIGKGPDSPGSGPFDVSTPGS
jgi:hypothetical protein